MLRYYGCPQQAALTQTFNSCEFCHQHVKTKQNTGFRLIEATSRNLPMAALAKCAFNALGNVHISKDNLVTRTKRLLALVLLAPWPTREHGRNKATCTTALRNTAAAPRSSFLHSEKICLCSFIVTNYSSVEDRTPQLSLTGNFREGLKIWITSPTSCTGLNSRAQT